MPRFLTVQPPSRTAELLLTVLWLVVLVSARPVCADNWPQFRGPGGSGVSTDDAELPADIGPDKHVLWKTPLAKGHSSPVVFGNRIYLTAFRNRKLLTLALDAETGKVLWEQESQYDKLESFHRIGSPATSSAATDGEVVISFFGSCGMNAFTPDGKLLWHKPMGPFNNQFGATSSPVLTGDRIVTIQDHDTGSFLAVLDKHTGKELWRQERPNMRRNYGSPVIWTVGGRKQVVIAGTAHLMGYDLQTGKLLWTVQGLCRVVSNTPVVGEDGRLYVASTGGGSAPPQPAFDDLLETADADNNGVLEQKELPKSRIKGFFGQFDRDGSGALDKTEYESIRKIFDVARSEAIAVKPGGIGNISTTHVLWRNARGIPRNASPLYYRGLLYLAKDGGVMTVLNAKTGETVRQLRLAGRGKYFSSPVAGDGKIYVLDDRGTLTVLAASGQMKQLHTDDFNEPVLATPAMADGRIYIRTTKTLYCFGEK